jgi:hypothetical protein
MSVLWAVGWGLGDRWGWSAGVVVRAEGCMVSPLALRVVTVADRVKREKPG